MYLKCEGETSRSPTIPNNTNPAWEFQEIFYQKRPQDPIVVEVGVGIHLLVFGNNTSRNSLENSTVSYLMIIEEELAAGR